MLLASMGAADADQPLAFCGDQVEITFVEPRPVAGLVQYWAEARNLTAGALSLRFSLSDDIVAAVLSGSGLVMQPGARLAAGATGPVHIAANPFVRGLRPTAAMIASALQVACAGAG